MLTLDPDPPAAALTRLTVSARSAQPTTSFPTPAARVTTPTSVSSSLSSVRIRQRTGKAVIDIADDRGTMRGTTDGVSERVREGLAPWEKCESGEGRGGRTDSNEEQKVAERDGVGVEKVVVDRHSDGCTESEWEGHPDRADGHRGSDILADHRHIHLEADDKQEQDQACRPTRKSEREISDGSELGMYDRRGDQWTDRRRR